MPKKDIEYYSMFLLCNLCRRKWDSTHEQWVSWLESLSDIEIRVVSFSMRFDIDVKRILQQRHLSPM